ncbi:MAG: radical SAM protein [Deltaproteobacteria bacterium]|nr:radical SAM protein [Deltaproteobacteria bacterium]
MKQLVSYYPSASHQVKLRQGKTDGLKLRRRATCSGHPEFDYPFVEADVAADPWVRCAVAGSFLTDERRYTASLERLRGLWLEQLATSSDAAEQQRGERLIRHLDDSPRRLVFEQLSQARRASRGEEPGTEPGDERAALEAATELLGPRERWLPAFRRFERDECPRLVVIPTWQCELRCRYCYIAKQDGRVMSRRTMERSVDLLLSCCRSDVLLQFFGGEPLVAWELVQHGIQYATDRAKQSGHSLSFIVSTNGWSLDEARLAWLADHPVRFELSLDGAPDTQNQYRHALTKREDSYVTGIASRVDAIVAAGLPYDVIMVVHPDNVERLVANFFHIADLGFQRIQVNFGLGAHWTERHQSSFADGLHQIGAELRRRWSEGQILSMVNLENEPLPMRLNGEITVDHDGTIYGGNGFLHETPHKDKFVIGHLDDLASFDRYRLDSPGNDYLLKWTYPPDITTNNLAVGRIMRSFVRWMREGGLGPEGD